MEILLKKIAKELKINMPDLITRSVGEKIYNRLIKQIKCINQGEVLVINFEGIKVIDPSCSDEIFVKLINYSKEANNNFYIRVKNISEIIDINLSSVFDSYSEFTKKRILLVAEDLSVKNLYCLGDISELEHEIIKYLKINKEATLKNIAEYLNKDELETKIILNEMNLLRVIRKNNNIYLTV